MQIAGLISAMMAMIVTIALGFLLEPLPKVRLHSIMNFDVPYLRFPQIPFAVCSSVWYCVYSNAD